MAVENYHLKWDSHLSYLNSSIATLYKNEKYADVVLYSSSSTSVSVSSSSSGGSSSGLPSANNLDHGIPTVGISAHKFILSSCSQFFATMFETAPVCVPNGSVLYVVLPPELSHRAIQILVQYMYIGEATVPNDILNEVLRGGEILKIRGLCRNSTSSAAATTSTTTNAHLPLHSQDKGLAPPYTQPFNGHHQSGTELYTNAKCLYRNNLCAPSTRYSIEQLQYGPAQPELRHLAETIMPKDSPVIIKSTTGKTAAPSIAGLAPTTSTLRLKSSKGMASGGAGGGITINKDVAIDPDSGKCPYEQLQQAPESLVKSAITSTICNEIGCNSCTLPPLSLNENENEMPREKSSSLRLRDYARDEQRDDLNSTSYAQNLCRPLCDEPDCFNGDLYEARNQLDQDQGKPTDNFVQIKQEPRELWPLTEPLENLSNAMEQRLNRSVEKSLMDYKLTLDDSIVKVEKDLLLEHKNDENEKILDGGRGYECDVCKATFGDVKIWMCHMETHDTVMGIRCREAAVLSGNDMGAHSKGGAAGAAVGPKTYIPKKKRRISQQENTDDHVTLLCDLCSKSFKTPADWVRHMNSQHTEMELALFNSSKRENEQKIISSANATAMLKHSTSCTNTANITSSSSSTSTSFPPPPLPSTEEYGSDRVCNICNKTFISHSIMTAHKQSHSINAPCNGIADSGGHRQMSDELGTPVTTTAPTQTTTPSSSSTTLTANRLGSFGDAQKQYDI